MAKKKNKKFQKNTQQKKNTAKERTRSRQIKEGKKEIAALSPEETAVEKELMEVVEELVQNQVQDSIASEDESISEDLSQSSLLKELSEKLSVIKDWIMENKRISFPVIAIVYTFIIILGTIIAHNHIVNGTIGANERKIIEEMTNAESHGADIVLEKDVAFDVRSTISATYISFDFSKKVKAKDASEIDSSFENNSDTNTYLDVVISYENKGDADFPAKNASVMSIKCGETEYPCFSAIETHEGKNLEFVMNEVIKPGEKTNIHYIFDVPQTMADMLTPIESKVIIDNVGYVIKLR